MSQDLAKLTDQELVAKHKEITAYLESERVNLKEKELRFSQAGMSPNQCWEDLVAGNVGDINELIWPFYFTSVNGTVLHGDTQSYSITISQEAPFVCLNLQKAVFLVTDSGLISEERVWINPYDPTAPFAPNLKYSMQDSSAQRRYLDNPANVDHVGNSRNPTIFPTPFMLLENSNTKLTFSNSHASNDYFVKFTFFGYRIRLQDSKRLMSLVSAM